MPFQFFPHERCQKIAEAAIEAKLHQRRQVMLGGIMEAFAENLQAAAANPSDQLRLDLQGMNREQQLVDGSVPLAIWLKNAVSYTVSAAPRAVFQSALDELNAQMQSLPPIPEPGSLPEYKEVIIHQDDMVDFDFLQRGVTAGASVAKLLIPRFVNGVRESSGSSNMFSGSGWLIAPQLLITNHHVISARTRNEALPDADSFRKQGLAAEVLFGYDAPGAGTPAIVSGLEAFDARLDYAILRVAPPAGLKPLKLFQGELAIDSGTGTPLNIIQHPRGTPKKVALRNNLATHADAVELRYFTDTDGGSSGSPVFNDHWEVVGLHRGALSLAQGVNFQGKKTAWVNVGTRISAILGDLKARYPEFLEQISG